MAPSLTARTFPLPSPRLAGAKVISSETSVIVLHPLLGSPPIFFAPSPFYCRSRVIASSASGAALAPAHRQEVVTTTVHRQSSGRR